MKEFYRLTLIYISNIFWYEYRMVKNENECSMGIQFKCQNNFNFQYKNGYERENYILLVPWNCLHGWSHSVHNWKIKKNKNVLKRVITLINIIQYVIIFFEKILKFFQTKSQKKFILFCTWHVTLTLLVFVYMSYDNNMRYDLLAKWIVVI